MIVDVHAHWHPKRYVELLGRPASPSRAASPATRSIPHLGGTLRFLLARVTRKSTEAITNGLRSMYDDTVSGCGA